MFRIVSRGEKARQENRNFKRWRVDKLVTFILISQIHLANTINKTLGPLRLVDAFLYYCCSSWACMKEALFLFITSNLMGILCLKCWSKEERRWRWRKQSPRQRRQNEILLSNSSMGESPHFSSWCPQGPFAALYTLLSVNYRNSKIKREKKFPQFFFYRLSCRRSWPTCQHPCSPLFFPHGTSFFLNSSSHAELLGEGREYWPRTIGVLKNAHFIFNHFAHVS